MKFAEGAGGRVKCCKPPKHYPSYPRYYPRYYPSWWPRAVLL